LVACVFGNALLSRASGSLLKLKGQRQPRGRVVAMLDRE
jgi:hypothetical protein